MNPPSLFTLTLLPLPLQEILEICLSGRFPPCTGIWKRKAELEFGFAGNFFDLYLGSEISTPRPIPESYRYLELGAINSFFPELAASRDRKTGQISGLFESFIGVKEAILQGNMEQFQFFFDRMKPEAKQELKKNLESVGKLSLLFPMGADRISFPVFNALLQGLGLPPLDKIVQPQDPSQQWILTGKPPRSIDQSVNDQKARMGGFVPNEILNNPLYFSHDVLLSLVEKGNEKALMELLSAFNDGRTQPTSKAIFRAILRSGRIDFVDAFEPYFKYVVLRSAAFDIDGIYEEKFAGFPTDFFLDAAYGGNQQIVNFLSQSNQQSSLDMMRNSESFTSVYLRAILDGFFLHRDVIAVHSLIEQITLNSTGIIHRSRINFSSLPIDVLDLLSHKIPFKEIYSAVDFFSQVLGQNLGYLNVVIFCLNGLATERGRENFFRHLERSGLSQVLERFEKLTPLSVSIVRSTLQSWALPPLVEND